MRGWILTDRGVSHFLSSCRPWRRAIRCAGSINSDPVAPAIIGALKPCPLPTAACPYGRQPRNRLSSNHVIDPAHLFDGSREPSRPKPEMRLRKALIHSGDREAHRRMRQASANPRKDRSGGAADTALEGTIFCACSFPPTWKHQLKRSCAVWMRGASRFHPERQTLQLPSFWTA